MIKGSDHARFQIVPANLKYLRNSMSNPYLKPRRRRESHEKPKWVASHTTAAYQQLLSFSKTNSKSSALGASQSRFHAHARYTSVSELFAGAFIRTLPNTVINIVLWNLTLNYTKDIFKTVISACHFVGQFPRLCCAQREGTSASKARTIRKYSRYTRRHYLSLCNV